MNKVLIIAEAGVNHNGDINLAKELVNVAAEAGADYVKFQTFKAESLVSRNAQKAQYQIENGSDKDETQFEMLKKLELSSSMHSELMKHCAVKGIKFLSTPFDVASIDYLSALDLDLFKIPSGEITNLPYLRKIAQTKKPIIMSTGMCEMDEVKAAVAVLREHGVKNEDLMLLHCNTEYPTPMSDVNLAAMVTMANELDVRTGYSDHTTGIEIPIAAVAMGAVCIEKHFTLDKQMDGPDHKASLDPNELTEMIRSIRNIEKALGDGIKRPSNSELKNRAIARKSIFVKANTKQGHILTMDDLSIKRPGDGISPMEIDQVLGKRMKKNADQEMMLSWHDLE